MPGAPAPGPLLLYKTQLWDARVQAPPLLYSLKNVNCAMQGVQAPPPGSTGAATGEYQPPAQVGRVICHGLGAESST